MAIAFRSPNGVGTGTGTGGSSPYNLVVTKPSGVADGDLLVVSLYVDDSTVASVPSGWTLCKEVENTYAPTHFWIRSYWKRASGEGASWTWSITTAGWYAWEVVAFTGGLAAGDALDGTPTSWTQPNALTYYAVPLPAVTTTVDGSMLVAACGNYDGRAWVSGTAPVTNERADANGLCHYDGVLASAGSSGTITISINVAQANQLCGVLFALKPASTTINAALTGTGTLAVGLGAVQSAIASALTGTGSVTVAAKIGSAVAASLTGAGTLTVGVTSGSPVAASLTGAGTLSATLGLSASPIAAALTGAGSLTASLGIADSAIAAALTGAGSLTAALTADTTVAASLTGDGVLSATLTADTTIAGALTGAGTLTAAVEVVSGETIIASLTGAGSLTVALGVVDTPIAGALAGAGSLTADLNAGSGIAAALTGDGTLSASLTADSTIAASLTGAGSLSAAVEVVSGETIRATLAGTGSLTVDLGSVDTSIGASLAGTGSLTASISVTEVVVPTPSPPRAGASLAMPQFYPERLSVPRGSSVIVLIVRARMPLLVVAAGRTVVGLSVVEARARPEPGLIRLAPLGLEARVAYLPGAVGQCVTLWARGTSDEGWVAAEVAAARRETAVERHKNAMLSRQLATEQAQAEEAMIMWLTSR